jgi:hypothetical protein
MNDNQPKPASVAEIAKRARKAWRAKVIATLPQECSDADFDAIITGVCENVEKIWFARLAKMQKIHERELQQLRGKLRGFCEAHDVDSDSCPCCEAVHERELREQSEANTKRIKKVVKELRTHAEWMGTPVGYESKDFEAMFQRADEAMK